MHPVAASFLHARRTVKFRGMELYYPSACVARALASWPAAWDAGVGVTLVLEGVQWHRSRASRRNESGLGPQSDSVDRPQTSQNDWPKYKPFANKFRRPKPDDCTDLLTLRARF
jgi:hypothetical protein